MKTKVCCWFLGLLFAGLVRAERPELVVQTGHADLVWAVAFSPDGKWLASASGDNTIKLWDVGTGKEWRTLPGHTESVVTLAFSPDGQTLASGSIDNTVRLWETRTGRCRELLKKISPRSLLGVHSLTFSPDGRFLAVAGEDGAIQLRNPSTGKLENTLTGHKGPVHALVFSPDGKTLASGGDDNHMKLWDPATGRELRTLTGHSELLDEKLLGPGADPQRIGGVFTVAFSPDGKLIASGGRDKNVILWETGTGQPRQTLRGHANSVVSVAFSPDGKTVASAGSEPGIKLWSVATGDELRTLVGHEKLVRTVAFSPDGKTLASGSDDKTIRLWDPATGKLFRTLAGHSTEVASVTFAPDGQTLMVVAGQNVIRRWDLGTGRELSPLRGHSGSIVSLAFSPDGKRMATSSWDQTIKLWDLPSGTERATLTGHTMPIQSVSFSPDGKSLASGSWDKTIRFWDLASTNVTQQITNLWQGVESIAFNPDGKSLVSVEVASSPKLWDVTSRQLIREFKKGESGSAEAVLFSPDGRLLAGRCQEVIHLWDVATGQWLRTFSGHGYKVTAIAFSPDGKLLASASDDMTVKLWQVATGEPVRTLIGHGHWVQSVAFSPDGKLLASSSQNGRIKLWDVATGRELALLLPEDESDYVIATGDGYYTASKGALAGVAFRLGTRAFPFDQFDLRLNRPDKIVETIGRSSPEIVAAYQAAYQKRLAKMGFNEAMLTDAFHLPELMIVTTDLPVLTAQKQLSIQVRATDSQHLLDRLNLFVNGVPVYGMSGIPLRQKKLAAWEQELTVELDSGRNAIQLSVLNDQGIESLRQTVEINCQAPARPPELYLAVIGVSEYRDAQFNLRYAAKDAADLARLFETHSGKFGRVQLRRLLDGQATRENIQKIRPWLMGSRVEDLALVFVAGHGLLDRKGDYYFGTADIDFQNPAARGLDYDSLESLLDGIPARRKLLLMDTCHAGEIDKEESVEQLASVAPAGVKSRSFRGTARPVSSGIGLRGSFELLQELFADLRRGSGAAVIAAAGGLEFSFEAEQWHNGVFTYAVLEGLQSARTDKNGDGQITVSELRDFVLDRVRQLTRGQQTPVSRRENLENDFTVYSQPKPDQPMNH